MPSAGVVPNGHGAPAGHDLSPQDRVVGDEQFIDDVMQLSEKYNLHPEDGEIFNARTLGHDPNIDPAQVSSAIPGSGLRDDIDQESGANGPVPSKYLPHITGPREEGMPADVRGGYEEEAPAEQEGATGRGPGMHEQDVSEVPVEGQGPNDLMKFADGTPRLNSDGTPRPVPSNQPNQNGQAIRSMPGVKEMEPPGPRTDISLAPRITHLQFHRPDDADVPSRKATAYGDPVEVTPDGEAEVPAYQNGHQMQGGRSLKHILTTTIHEDIEQSNGQPPIHRDIENTEVYYTPEPFAGPSGRVNGAGTSHTHSDHHEGETYEEELLDHGLGRVPPPEDEWEDAHDQHWVSAYTAPVTPLTPRRSSFSPSIVRRYSAAPPRPRPQVSSGDEMGASSPHPHTPRGQQMRNALRFGRKKRDAPREQFNQGANPPNMTNELLANTLPVMIMKTWIDRDEEGRRAVPVLLGNLRFRICDSVRVGNKKEHKRLQIASADKPMTDKEKDKGGREWFKIECEYGEGVIKWVIYRELRDFVSLHAHYKAANVGTGISGLRSSRRVEIPEFPRQILPYWARDSGSVYKEMEHKLEEKVEPHKAKAKQQASRNNNPHAGPRELLEQYLVDLIRAVMFRPESNRLCIFFELSALTVALAPRGGFQGKAGFIKIPSIHVSRKNNQPGIVPSKWKNHRKPKWFIVRESYFVSTNGPQETDVYDVFIIDNDFAIERPKRAYRKGLKALRRHQDTSVDDIPQEMQEDDEKDASQHTFYISNAQRRIKLVAKSARAMHQFIVSMERVAMQTLWAGRNRFDSFAPIRVNVAAQWLVDGRDYFWNLSRAINMAKNRIYIHDWWISPEIYLRRPGDERYRLDNLLKRKAEEGVHIFIIIYNEVTDAATPVNSPYTKKTLQGLHPNIMVQRSPSHLPNGTFYWSHHEKLCVIDETIAFMGGLDLCFGRWDTPQHCLTDEDFTEPSGPNGPIWRGKDYFNERIDEYADLDKPFEDRFDRSRQPRMPWHDVGLQLLGQPARDLCRHFCQRWNLLLRTKNHTRKMPFLLPPADFTERELVDLHLNGTCEVQICRSCGPWSMGTNAKIEHSITNAYVKSIQLSEHFVYIENQFFITSTVVDNTVVKNHIGDALVERIIRAHKNGEDWRACVVIPLLPGYSYPVDKPEASSLRLILECQNRTICRGAHSIFTRLRKEGINPDDYINFFSLRTWAKFKTGALTSEMVYIHGKTMIVDDRIVLCGSANINERSQLGDRDSELLAVVRDTDMIDGTMAGKPFKVGRYSHTLRVRLMREHIGVDVDAIEEDDLMMRKPLADAHDVALWDPDGEQDNNGAESGVSRLHNKSNAVQRLNLTVETAVRDIAAGVGTNLKLDVERTALKVMHPIKAMKGEAPQAMPWEGDPADRTDVGMHGQPVEGFASSVVPTLEEVTLMRQAGVEAREVPMKEVDGGEMTTGGVVGLPIVDGDGNPIGAPHNHPTDVQDVYNPGPSAVAGVGGPAAQEAADAAAHKAEKAQKAQNRHLQLPHLHEHHHQHPPRDDPQANGHQESTADLRRVPSNSTAVSHADSYGRPAGGSINQAGDDTTTVDPSKARDVLRKHLHKKTPATEQTLPVETPDIDPNRFHDPLDKEFWNDMWVATAVSNTEIFRKVFRCIPDDMVTTWDQYKSFANHADKFLKRREHKTADTKITHDADGSGGGVVGPAGQDPAQPVTGDTLKQEATGKAQPLDGHDIHGKPNGAPPGLGKPNERAGPTPAESAIGEEEEKKPSGDDEPWAQWELDNMERLLQKVKGHLVVYPTRFLEAEDMANNFLFNQERILPLLIYD